MLGLAVFCTLWPSMSAFLAFQMHIVFVAMLSKVSAPVHNKLWCFTAVLKALLLYVFAGDGFDPCSAPEPQVQQP